MTWRLWAAACLGLAHMAGGILILLSLLLAGCTVERYRAIPPAGATDQDIRRVGSYCRLYTDPEACYLASGYRLERLERDSPGKSGQPMQVVDWRTTF